MKAKTIVELGCACEHCKGGSEGCRDFPDGKIPIGTIKTEPDVYKLVQMGVAVAADDECERAANMTPQRLAAAQHAQQRATRGIHPDDFGAYDGGEMTGYYPDGSFIPGPNTRETDGGILLDDFIDSDV